MREKSNQKCSNNFLWAQYVDVLYFFLDTDYQTERISKKELHRYTGFVS